MCWGQLRSPENSESVSAAQCQSSAFSDADVRGRSDELACEPELDP